MNARDELTDLIEDAVGDAIYNAADAPPSLTGIVASCAADALIGAGYSRPRTVSTVAELDALPFESVIRDQQGHILERWGEVPDENIWATVMVSKFIPRDDIALPASVLYEPEGK